MTESEYISWLSYYFYFGGLFLCGISFPALIPDQNQIVVAMFGFSYGMGILALLIATILPFFGVQAYEKELAKFKG